MHKFHYDSVTCHTLNLTWLVSNTAAHRLLVASPSPVGLTSEITHMHSESKAELSVIRAETQSIIATELATMKHEIASEVEAMMKSEMAAMIKDLKAVLLPKV